MRPSLYGADLAHVHVDGYGFHWERASPAVLKRLREGGVRTGTVVDLGCGGGQWLARLQAKGYTAVGVDASAAMIRAARKAAPNAKLIRGSFADVKLPLCDAVTSLGESLNYLSGAREFRRTLQHVHTALRPGGLFIFDVRTPPTEKVATRVAARTGDDWACIAVIDELPTTQRLTRHITTFRRVGRYYRRSEEVHVLRLYPEAQIRGWLCELGFRLRTFPNYGRYKVMPRQLVIIAQKC